MCLFSRRPWALLVLPVLAALCSTGPARADSLDAPLAGYTERDVLSALKAKGKKAVGVLPFKVKKGKAAASYVNAPICSGMATRLENMLILVSPQNSLDSVRVIRDAAGTASRGRAGAWAKDESARRRLFELNYAPAWGFDKAGKAPPVKADAFLTGTLDHTGKDGKLRVTIEAFYKDKPTALVKLTEFSVDADRALMGDLGYNFTLARSLVRSRSPRERDRMVVSLVRRREEGGNQPAPPDVTLATPENVAGFTVGVQYGGRDVDIKPISEGNPDGGYYIPPVPAGSEFVLNLTYNGQVDGKLGVIVKFNGASTWQQETGESLNLRKWIYNRDANLNKVDPFKGFYIDTEGNYLPFKVLTPAESEAKLAEMGERVGWIDIDVFASGEAKTQDEPKRVTSRGVPRVIDAKAKKIEPSKPATLKEAQDQLCQTNHVQRSLVRRRGPDEGGIIIPSETAATAGPVTQGQLPNPVLIGSLRIRYYEPNRLRVTP